MEDSSIEITDPIKCEHCDNIVRLRRIFLHDQTKSYETPDGRWNWQAGPVWTLYECPTCSGIIFSCYYLDDRYDPEDWESETLYPHKDRNIEGLPNRVNREYKTALKVRNLDSNLYAVAIGRMMEALCTDQGATGDMLGKLLKSLSENEGVPKHLIDMARQLQSLRNIGAHATAGDITTMEVPILDKLVRIILEYFYVVPRLIKQVESRIEQLKKGNE